MTKQLLTKFLFVLLIGAGIFEKVNAQCTPRALPFNENFSVTPFATCTPTVGGWKSTSAASGAGWWLPNTNYAGGSVPEVEAYGDQANGGVMETIYLIAPPLNVQACQISVSFKHSLYLTNSAASGSGTITVALESSPDSANWTQRYADYFQATSSLTQVTSGTITQQFVIPSATGYIRFRLTGVLFKVWGWEIDNVNVTCAVASYVQPLTLTDKMIYQNQDDKKLEINIGEGRNCNAVLHDMLGNIIYKSGINSRAVIDMSNYRNGIYILRLENETGTVTKKLVMD